MTASSPSLALRVTHATGTVVIGEDHDGVCRIYVLSPTGWRMRKDPLRNDGHLVIDPRLIGVLDSAAANLTEHSGGRGGRLV